MKGWLMALALAMTLTACGMRTTPADDGNRYPETVPNVPVTEGNNTTGTGSNAAAEPATAAPTQQSADDTRYYAGRDGVVPGEEMPTAWQDRTGTNAPTEAATGDSVSNGLRRMVDGTADAARDVTGGIVNGAERMADGVIDGADRMGDGIRNSAAKAAAQR